MPAVSPSAPAWWAVPLVTSLAVLVGVVIAQLVAFRLARGQRLHEQWLQHLNRLTEAQERARAARQELYMDFLGAATNYTRYNYRIGARARQGEHSDAVVLQDLRRRSEDAYADVVRARELIRLVAPPRVIEAMSALNDALYLELELYSRWGSFSPTAPGEEVLKPQQMQNAARASRAAAEEAFRRAARRDLGLG